MWCVLVRQKGDKQCSKRLMELFENNSQTPLSDALQVHVRKQHLKQQKKKKAEDGFQQCYRLWFLCGFDSISIFQ